MRVMRVCSGDAVTSADNHQHCYKTTPQLMLECLQDTTTQQLMLECFMLCATTMLASTSVSAPC